MRPDQEAYTDAVSELLEVLEDHGQELPGLVCVAYWKVCDAARQMARKTNQKLHRDVNSITPRETNENQD